MKVIQIDSEEVGKGRKTSLSTHLLYAAPQAFNRAHSFVNNSPVDMLSYTNAI